MLALIITIIVLLILAMVSIKIITNHDVIKYSKDATNNYSAEEEIEKIKLGLASRRMGTATNASAELKVDGATVTGDANTGWLVTFPKTGDEFTVNLNGDITKKDSSTNIPDTNTKLFNISFKDPSKIDWSGVNISATEALIIEKENGDKMLILLYKDVGYRSYGT